MITAAGALYRLRVLGAPALVDESGLTPRALGRGKPLALLCYLAVRGEVRRDEIVDLLWRDVDEARARNAFRQALHRLRLALGDEIVPHDRDRLRLGDSSRLAVDLVEFESAATAGRLGDAVELYTGDFLDAFDLREPPFDLWAEQERTRLRARFRQILHDAALEAASAGHWDDAVGRTRRLLALTPFDGDAAHLAATTLVSAGRRIEALELLREFQTRIQGEMHVELRDDLQTLMSRLVRESTAREPRATPASADSPLNSVPFIGRTAELSQLLTLWRRVGEDAGAVALIEGDRASGKSRLIHEVAVHARSLGPALVLVGRERFGGAQVPFGVFAEALKPAVRAPGVAGASAHLLAEAARLLPELRDSLDLPTVPNVEDESARLRFFEGVAAFIDAAAYEQRTILALDDAEHLLPASLDLLSYLVGRLAGAPVMFVVSVNPANAPSELLGRLRALTAPHDRGNGRTGALRLVLQSPAPTAVSKAPAEVGWARRIFPHWPILLTAAIAAALIAALALATRDSAIADRSSPADTLVVVESDAGARRTERLAVGSLTTGFSLSERLERRPAGPRWADSVTRPWLRMLPSPRGDRVALARADSVGEPLVIVSADRRDTVALHVRGSNPVPLAWSPDGSRLLVSTTIRLSNSDFDSDLRIVPVTGSGAEVVIDTAAARGIVEAQWAPDGSHFAWVARVGARRQLDVFVALADGSEIRNVSGSEADDYHIAWSPNGELLAFTSTRDGNPELYAADLAEHRLWRLTTSVAHDDRATFAPSGRFVAFESTRDGFGGVYVVAPLGGKVMAVDTRHPLDIGGWRSAPPRYVDRISVEAPMLGRIGATGRATIRALDRRGDSMSVQHVEWRVLDSTVTFGDSGADFSSVRELRARATGLARVVATVGHWRSDTAVVRVGDDRVTLLEERFRADWQRRWRALGDPEPVLAKAAPAPALTLRAPKSWDSGILSTETVPLLPGLSVSADFAGPFGHPSDAGMVVTLALAAPENDADVDAAAPQLLRLVALSWNAESRRLIYSVGREAFSESADSLLETDALSATIRVMRDSTVSFAVGGTERWRSGLRVSGVQFGTRAQLWISARATGDQVRVFRVTAAVEPVSGTP